MRIDERRVATHDGREISRLAQELNGGGGAVLAAEVWPPVELDQERLVRPGHLLRHEIKSSSHHRSAPDTAAAQQSHSGNHHGSNSRNGTNNKGSARKKKKNAIKKHAYSIKIRPNQGKRALSLSTNSTACACIISLPSPACLCLPHRKVRRGRSCYQGPFSFSSHVFFLFFSPKRGGFALLEKEKNSKGEGRDLVKDAVHAGPDGVESTQGRCDGRIRGVVTDKQQNTHQKQ